MIFHILRVQLLSIRNILLKLLETFLPMFVTISEEIRIYRYKSKHLRHLERKKLVFVASNYLTGYLYCAFHVFFM